MIEGQILNDLYFFSTCLLLVLKTNKQTNNNNNNNKKQPRNPPKPNTHDVPSDFIVESHRTMSVTLAR